MVFLLLFLIGIVWSQNGCENDWTEYNGRCYKHFNTPKARDNLVGTRLKCQALGGDIATGATQGEREFMEKLTVPTYNGNLPIGDSFDEMLLLGIFYMSNGTWISVDPTEKVDSQWEWCGTSEPNYLYEERCTHSRMNGTSKDRWNYRCTVSQINGFCNFPCHRLGRRYICRKQKPLVCKNADTVAKDGKCVCKEGYVDILQTDDLDKNKYKEGEKCVPKNPCNSLRKSLSLIFIVDASQSIQERNWPSLVDFVKSASSLIPNQVNVGFIKFSTKISFADWLPTKWSQNEFQRMVPDDFDAGYTNTPAAIEKAIEMFDEDGRNANKVAVLITDGLPVVDDQTDKEKGLSDTRAAISKLQRKGVDVVAFGFGPELKQQRGDTYIKKWLSDPEEDYFSFDRMACDLRKVHMQMLLEKVCRRYV